MISRNPDADNRSVIRFDHATRHRRRIASSVAIHRSSATTVEESHSDRGSHNPYDQWLSLLKRSRLLTLGGSRRATACSRKWQNIIIMIKPSNWMPANCKFENKSVAVVVKKK